MTTRKYLKQFFRCSVLVLLLGMFAGCGSHVYHHVRDGETLYSISWRYHQDYRQVAKWNQLEAPYVIQKGQWLRVVPPGKENWPGAKKSKPETPAKTVSSAAVSNDSAKSATPPASPSPKSRLNVSWQWPVQGAVISTYAAEVPGRQGIDVDGKLGSPVRAAASGKVVYSGNGLRGYGNLIIIKHNDKFLSAYGHNQSILVKEGESVNKGQTIARMGNTEAERIKLHFQIRIDGKPIDPLRYLPKRGS